MLKRSEDIVQSPVSGCIPTSQPLPHSIPLKKNPKDYIIKLKNVSSNKLSFLVVKSHIFEGEAVISYLEMFSFGYELSLPVNCFYHRTSSLASSGRVLWQEAAERKSLGPGGLPRPSQLPGSSSGRSSGHRDPFLIFLKQSRKSSFLWMRSSAEGISLSCWLENYKGYNSNLLLCLFFHRVRSI